MLTYFAQIRRLNRDVQMLLVSAGLLGLTVLGGVYGVLFNLFILRLGFGPEFVGLVNAVGMLAFAVPALPASWIGSRFGTRTALMLGMAVTALGYGMLALSDTLPMDSRGAWLLTWNTVGALGSAVYLVNVGPFLVEVCALEDRARALSVQVAVWPMAGFVGSLVGGALPGLAAPLVGALPDDPAAFRLPMLFAAVLVLPGVLALRAARRTPPLPREEGTRERAPMRTVLAIACSVMLQVGCEGVAMTFFNVYLDDGLGVPTAQIGLLIAVARLVTVPAALLSPLAMERWGTRQTFVIASLGLVACMVPLALVQHWVAAELGYLGVVCLAAIARSAVTTLQMDAVGPRWRGTISAATTMGVGLSWSALSLGGGYAIQLLGYPALFLSGMALTVVGIAVFCLTVGLAPPRPSPAADAR